MGRKNKDRPFLYRVSSVAGDLLSLEVKVLSSLVGVDTICTRAYTQHHREYHDTIDKLHVDLNALAR